MNNCNNSKFIDVGNNQLLLLLLLEGPEPESDILQENQQQNYQPQYQNQNQNQNVNLALHQYQQSQYLDIPLQQTQSMQQQNQLMQVPQVILQQSTTTPHQINQLPMQPTQQIQHPLIPQIPLHLYLSTMQVSQAYRLPVLQSYTNYRNTDFLSTQNLSDGLVKLESQDECDCQQQPPQIQQLTMFSLQQNVNIPFFNQLVISNPQPQIQASIKTEKDSKLKKIPKRALSAREVPDSHNIVAAIRKPKSGVKRSRTGCLTCRQRKKRCCETKPECTECHRLGLLCVWPIPRTERKNKQKSARVDEDTIEHEIYGKINLLRGIVEYKSEQ